MRELNDLVQQQYHAIETGEDFTFFTQEDMIDKVLGLRSGCRRGKGSGWRPKSTAGEGSSQATQRREITRLQHELQQQREEMLQRDEISQKIQEDMQLQLQNQQEEILQRDERSRKQHEDIQLQIEKQRENFQLLYKLFSAQLPPPM